MQADERTGDNIRRQARGDRRQVLSLRGPLSEAKGPKQSQGGLADWQLEGGIWVQIRERLAGCLTDFRRIVGMPDYPAYVKHLRQVHPSWPIPSEREFFALYLQTRYGDGPTRCC